MSVRPLLKHQDGGVEYFLSTDSPALLWEMRLGKTLVAVRGTIARKDSIRNLVNAPINAMSSWEKELYLEDEIYVKAYACSSKERATAIDKALSYGKRVWVLVNFEGYRHLKQIADIPWDSVIVDESVKLKNPQAQVSQLFAEKFRNVKYRAILSGLVAPESELDLFQQFKFLHGQFMSKQGYYSFRNTYFDQSPDGYSYLPKKGIKEEIKKIVHAKSNVLRRHQAGLNKKKVYSIRKVRMNAEQKKLYSQVSKDFAYEFRGLESDETIWATEKAIWMARIAGGFSPDGKTCISTAKPDEILYLLQNDLKGEKIVIWYRFVAELLFDLEYFKKNGIKCSNMHGGMFQKQKDFNEREFQAGKSQLMLCMERLGDKAKDFSIASTAIYRSNEFSGDMRGQSEDRILHPLKNDALLYIDLIAEDTSDEKGLEIVQGKVWNARELMTRFSEGSASFKPGILNAVGEALTAKSKVPQIYTARDMVNFDDEEYDPFKE